MRLSALLVRMLNGDENDGGGFGPLALGSLCGMYLAGWAIEVWYFGSDARAREILWRNLQW